MTGDRMDRKEFMAALGRAGLGGCLCASVLAARAAFAAEGPKAMTPTFCWCSAGGVQELHERVFGRPVKAELLESVLLRPPALQAPHHAGVARQPVRRPRQRTVCCQICLTDRGN